MDVDLSSHIRKYHSGDTVFTEGDDGSTMYFIHSGEVRILKSIDGKTETLATLQKGDFFGEMSLMERSSRSATATVNGETELLVVDVDNFEKLLQSNVEIAIRMIRKYISRLRETNERLQQTLSIKNRMDQEILEFVKAPTKATPSTETKAIAALLIGANKLLLYTTDCVLGRIDPATGLTPDIDLTANDPEKTVSRKHARIRRTKEGIFEISEELGVRNGTHVNGAKIQPGSVIALKHGDTLQLGKVSLTFHITS